MLGLSAIFGTAEPAKPKRFIKKYLVVFQYEGLFRQDCILKGHNRNTAWFSMIDDEWPELKNAYQQWMSPDNFDEYGFQKQKLSDFLIE